MQGISWVNENFIELELFIPFSCKYVTNWNSNYYYFYYFHSSC